MSLQAVEPGTVSRAFCDGPGCTASELYEPNDEADVPVGWCRMGIAPGFRQFHKLSCASGWLTALTAEVRTAYGWDINYTADYITWPA